MKSATDSARAGDELSPWATKKIAVRLTLLFVLAFVVALFLIPKKQYVELLLQKLIAAARSQGYIVTVSEPNISVVTLTAQEMQFFIPAALTTVIIKDLSVRPDLWSIFGATWGASANGTAYGGACSLSAHRKIFGGELGGELSISNLNLAQLPQLQAFGVQHGSLSASVDHATVDPARGLQSGDWTVNIAGLNKVQDTFAQLAPELGGLYLAIPAFENLTLQAHGAINDTAVTITDLTSQSSLGSFSLHGTIDRGNRGAIEIAGTAQLSPQTQQKYGAFVSLAANGRVQPDASSFAFHVTGRPPGLKMKLTPP